MKMTVAELIQQLEKMPQDAGIAVGTDAMYVIEDIEIILERCTSGDYVFIGRY